MRVCFLFCQVWAHCILPFIFRETALILVSCISCGFKVHLPGKYIHQPCHSLTLVWDNLVTDGGGALLPRWQCFELLFKSPMYLFTSPTATFFLFVKIFSWRSWARCELWVGQCQQKSGLLHNMCIWAAALHCSVSYKRTFRMKAKKWWLEMFLSTMKLHKRVGEPDYRLPCYVFLFVCWQLDIQEHSS